jgi:SDR family mycofactocin-dependent oxidoreductase
VSRLRGKVAFITGAARGQGRSHAVQLANEGADIIAIDACQPFEGTYYPPATEADLDETARLVEATGRSIRTAVVDVRDLDGLTKVVTDSVADLGHLDVVVANAGICTVQKWDQITPARWEEVIGINLTGVWNTCAASIPHLIAAGGGSIILTSSVAGLKGQPYLLPYVASKHGVVGLMHGLTNELAPYQIRVNTVHPTGVRTPMGTDTTGGEGLIVSGDFTMSAIFMNSLPVEVIEPEDVSRAVLFLASDESRYVTGLTMTIDAGATAR